MTAPTPDPTAGERPHDCEGWDSCPNPAHRATPDAPDPTAGEGLSEAEALIVDEGAALYGWATADEAHQSMVAAVERIVRARESATATRARAEALREAADEYAALGIDEGVCQCLRADRGRPCYCDAEEWLRARADALAAHPDYREEWKP